MNQQVYGKKTKGVVKTANRVPEAHQQDLDRVCERYGLRWRKVFQEDGLVDPKYPTFIQESYSAFKRLAREEGAECEYIQRHFEGYPHKHRKQERLDVQAKKTAPPRWRAGRCKKDES